MGKREIKRKTRKKRQNKHKQIIVDSLYGKVKIDYGMKDIICSMWKNGIDTSSCCRDNIGESYIQFPLSGYKRLMILSYVHNVKINGGDNWKIPTLYSFLFGIYDTHINFHSWVDWEDLKTDDTLFYVGIRFDKSRLKEFHGLLKDCFKK